MNTKIRKRMMRLSVLVPLGAALALVATGLGVAATSARVPVVGYRLSAQLTPAQEVPAVQAPALAKGQFEALLVRSGPRGVVPGRGPLFEVENVRQDVVDRSRKHLRQIMHFVRDLAQSQIVVCIA